MSHAHGHKEIIAVNGYHPLSAHKHFLVSNGIFVMGGGSKKIRTLTAKPNREDMEFVLDLARL